MVAAAFDSLKDENTLIKKTDNVKPDEIDERIINANTVMGLLSVAEGNTSVTRKHALKVICSSNNTYNLCSKRNSLRLSPY